MRIRHSFPGLYSNPVDIVRNLCVRLREGNLGWNKFVFITWNNSIRPIVYQSIFICFRLIQWHISIICICRIFQLILDGIIGFMHSKMYSLVRLNALDVATIFLQKDIIDEIVTIIELLIIWILRWLSAQEMSWECTSLPLPSCVTETYIK